MKRSVRRAAPAAGVALLIAYALHWIIPKQTRNAMIESAVWSLVVVVSFAGWGSLLRFAIARKERVDLGLRVAWGASVVCALGGLLMVPAMCTRGAQLFLVEAGIALAFGALLHERAAVYRAFAFGTRFMRREPRFVVVLAVALGFFALHYLGGVAEAHTNPYDDDIAYYPFVRKLFATGTVIEPFSFRRLSALGGQTLFVGLVALRGDLAQANTFDRSMCPLIIALLVMGFRAEGRRVSALVALVTVAFLMTLPYVGINTASYFSGIAFFFALLRTLVWVGARGDVASWRNALPLALVSATACTLRQNYLPVPAVMLVASAVSAIVSKRAWNRVAFLRALLEPVLVGAFTLAALAPWLVVSWQSNRTFLYPLMPGTFNRALALVATDPSVIRELRVQLGTFLEGIPVKVLGMFVLAVAFVRERDPRRPLASFWLGIAAGFVMLVHGLTQGDHGNVGRYALPSAIAGVLAVILVSTTRRSVREGGLLRDRFLRDRQKTAAGIALVAVFVQLGLSHENLFKSYKHLLSNITIASHTLPALPVPKDGEIWKTYERLQFATPENARIAVLVDQPYLLNYSRNDIVNLDMPGYSSPAPGMPFFQGSEKVEAYLKSLGFRYLLYVKPEYSSYHYRRDYWVEILLDEMELWRNFAAYIIDFIDHLKEIGERHRHLWEERGMVMLDLEAPK